MPKTYWIDAHYPAQPDGKEAVTHRSEYDSEAERDRCVDFFEYINSSPNVYPEGAKIVAIGESESE